MRYILYSPGYGAGWTTWNENRARDFASSYQPIVDFLLAGNTFKGKLGRLDLPEIERFEEPGRSILVQFLEDLKTATGVESFYLGGADQLKVYCSATGELVRIREYDGYETVETRDEVDNEWF